MEGKISKAIGISEKGIELVDKISKMDISHTFIEKIDKNKDVDKDFVRKLLDEIEILYLVFDSTDKRAVEIVKAIGFMAAERKTLCIGFDFSTDKPIKIEEIDRYIQFDSTDKRAVEIVKAIGFMAAERKTLCIGFDFSTDKPIKIEEIDRYIQAEEEKLSEIADLMDMMAESITEEPILNLDITDLRDIMITDKDIKYI